MKLHQLQPVLHRAGHTVQLPKLGAPSSGARHAVPLFPGCIASDEAVNLHCHPTGVGTAQIRLLMHKTCPVRQVTSHVLGPCPACSPAGVVTAWDQAADGADGMLLRAAQSWPMPPVACCVPPQFQYSAYLQVQQKGGWGPSRCRRPVWQCRDLRAPVLWSRGGHPRSSARSPGRGGCGAL